MSAIPAGWVVKFEVAVSLVSEVPSSLQNSSDIALRFVGSARFIQNLYATAPSTGLKRNCARAAAFAPRSIVTEFVSNRRTSMTFGCLNTVGVAVGMPVGAAVSPGANGARV